MKHRFDAIFEPLPNIPCREEKIRQTIAAAREAFAGGEAREPLSPMAFLYQQSQYIQKRWWLIQALLLCAVWVILSESDCDLGIRRSLGLAAPLFVILILPELWKNRNAKATEIECTTYYSLRQVYAARLSLFAGVDVALLTVFFLRASLTARLTVWEILIQFLLPFNVTCCICFRCLYSRRAGSEAFSLLLCSVWTALWQGIVHNEALYQAISIPLWAGMLTVSLLYMGYTLCRGYQQWQKIPEVKPLWN